MRRLEGTIILRLFAASGLALTLLAIVLVTVDFFSSPAAASTQPETRELPPVALPPARPLQANEIVITKTATTAANPTNGLTVSDGEYVTYTITIHNISSGAITGGITVTDQVPINALSDIECITPSSPPGFACQPLQTTIVFTNKDPNDPNNIITVTIPIIDKVQWTINSLGPGETAVGQFRARAACQPDGTPFQNFAVLNYNGGAQFSNPVQTIVRVNLPASAGQPVASNAPTWCSQITDVGGFFDMDWGDYDADGDLDLLLVSSNSTIGVVVYRNNGNGQFTRLSVFNKFSLSSARWGNFNGDGRLDILVTGFWQFLPSQGPTGPYSYTGFNYVFLNGGGDTFTLVNNGTDASGQPFTFRSNDGMFRAAVVDYDNDGRVDAALGNNYDLPNGCALQVNRNNGGGTIFQVTLPNAAIWNSTNLRCLIREASVRGLAWGDFDNDGLNDLAAGVTDFGSGSRINVFRQNPVNTFSPVFTSAGVLPNSVYDVRWGDYDSDGDLDLAAAMGSEVRIYNNNGNGTLNSNASQTLSGFTSFFVTAIDWLDFDGDGQLELAVADRPLRIYDNLTGTPTFIPLTAIGSGTIYTLRGADYDNDGDPDIAYINFNDKALLLTTFSAFLARGLTSIDASQGSGVALGDVDGGGLEGGSNNFLVGAASPVNRLYAPNNGSFQLQLPFLSPSSDVAFADLESDGDLDIAAGIAGGKNQLYRFDAGTYPLFPSWQSSPSFDTRALTFGDFDQDNSGRQELIVANNNAPLNFYPNEDLLLLASAPTWTSAESGPGRAIAWGYLDSDVLPDFAVGNYGQPNRVYHNNGDDTFSLINWTPSVGNDTTRSVAWGDYDNDGDMDLAVGNENNPNYIYENQNGVLSQTPVWSSTTAFSTTSVAWGDWDNDGDLDLATGNSGQRDRVYANLGSSPGSPRFFWVWQSSSNNNTQDVAWADVDGDGDLDLAMAGLGQNGFYENGYVAPAHLGVTNMPQPLNSSYLSIQRPKPGAGQIWYRTVLSNPNTLQIPVRFTVYDPDGIRQNGLRNNPAGIAGQFAVTTSVKYSVKGSGNWQPATGALSFSGGQYTFNWQAGQNLDSAAKAASDDVRLRITIVPINKNGLVQRASVSALSPPFRVRNLSCVWPEAPLISYQPVSSIATNIPMTFTGFVNAGSGALVFDWDFGDGASATGQVVYHTYTNANTFPITLTVSGPACPTTRSDRVTINLDVGPGQSIESELVYLPIIIKSAAGATSTGMPPSVSGPMPVEVSIPALAIGPGSPAQVAGLQGYEPGDGTTRLEWNANSPADGVLGYRIYRSPAGFPSFQLAAEVAAAVTTYTDNEAACGQMYFVTAYNGQGESLPSTASYFSPPCP